MQSVMRSRSVKVAAQEFQRPPVRERGRRRVVRRAVPAIESMARGIDVEFRVLALERRFHPFDRLEVLDARPLASKPHVGLVRNRWQMFNQRGEEVMQMEGYGMFLRRPV